MLDNLVDKLMESIGDGLLDKLGDKLLGSIADKLLGILVDKVVEIYLILLVINFCNIRDLELIAKINCHENLIFP